MKEHNERYEINFEKIQDEGGIVVDVIAKPYGKEVMPDIKGKMGLVFMSEDKGEDKKGNELGHKIWGFFEFKDVDNLKIAQMGLELIQTAMGLEDDAEAPTIKE